MPDSKQRKLLSLNDASPGQDYLKRKPCPLLPFSVGFSTSAIQYSPTPLSQIYQASYWLGKLLSSLCFELSQGCLHLTIFHFPTVSQKFVNKGILNIFEQIWSKGQAGNRGRVSAFFSFFFNLTVLQIVLCPTVFVLLLHEGQELCPSLLNSTLLLTKVSIVSPETK